MWFNSTISEEPYPGLTSTESSGNRGVPSRSCMTGDAWSSSARGLSCSVKWGNERNPCRCVICVIARLPRLHGEEGEDDVKSAWPLCLGLHTCYNGVYKGKQYRKVEQILKTLSQFGLRSATRPHEVGIASNRESAHVAVNTFPSLVLTARHVMEGRNTRSSSSNMGVQGRTTDWAEVVTRYP